MPLDIITGKLICHKWLGKSTGKLITEKKNYEIICQANNHS